MLSQLPRREFVGAPFSAATVSSVPIHHLLSPPWGGPSSTPVADGKDEGVLFLDKSDAMTVSRLAAPLVVRRHYHREVQHDPASDRSKPRCRDGLRPRSDLPALFDVSLDVRQEVSSKFHEEVHNDMLGGIVVPKHPGAIGEKSASHVALYRPYSADAPKARQVELKFAPYYAWANRAATPIKVGRRSARCRKPG